MASSALEEKINKIKLQNEEIRRRYEEVEADKKNAAKLNALVKMVPSNDWPERKEPPEFSTPPKSMHKQKILNKEHNDRLTQHYSGIHERLGKKDHKFAQGDGPPPDPKYNFLADSEREICVTDNNRVDESKNRSRNKVLRSGSKRKGDNGRGTKDAYFKDNRGPHAFYSKEEALPEYEAWRAERNRIDEARINRQKTAEGNWRREWDNNKTNVEKDPSKKGESNRKDSNNYERRNNHYDYSDSTHRVYGGSRTYHGSQKNHNHQDYRRLHYEQVYEYKRQLDNKSMLLPTDDRTVIATDNSIKITLNHGSQAKGPVMSVKVNSPSIAGTGRVGPRQKSRLTYSSQSDADVTNYELSSFSRQKSFDEKTTGGHFNNGKKLTPKSPFSQKKKEGTAKSSYQQKKEFKNDGLSTHSKIIVKPPYCQINEPKDQRQLNNFTVKLRVQKQNQKPLINKEKSLSISDDAIPSEYNPDKSFDNREDLIKHIETNNIDEKFSGNLKNINKSLMKEKSMNENKCDSDMENIHHQNSDNVKIGYINKNNEHIKINESIVKNHKADINIEGIKLDKNIKNEEVDTKIDFTTIHTSLKSLENDDYIEERNEPYNDKNYKNIEEDMTKIRNCNNVLQDIKKKNGKLLPDTSNDIVDHQHSLCMFTQENVIQDISNDTPYILPSEFIKKNETIKSCENNIIKTIDSRDVTDKSKSINNEFQQININLNTNLAVSEMDNITNEIVDLQENKIIELNISLNKPINDSDFIDNNITNESLKLNKTKMIEIIDSEKKFANDSGFIDDFDKLQNNFNASIIEFNNENDTDKLSQNVLISDSMKLTKEVYKKGIGICDIRSATSKKVSEVIEGHPEKISNSVDKQEIKKILENHTKDIDIQKVKQIDLIERENSIKKKL